MESDQQKALGRAGLWVLLAALILRLVWGALVPVVPVSDSHAYDVFAQNIAQGLGYGWEAGRLTAYWPVGTSAIYALLYWVFGHNYTAVMLFQAGVGVAVVALCMSIAFRWFGYAVAIRTGWIMACWPLLIQYTTILASEQFFIFTILCAFWFASTPGREWVWKGVTTGITLAGASYIRPTALLMAPILFAREFFKDGRRVKSIMACMLAIVVMIALILPWSVRNLQVFDRFVLISTNGGANLWMGNNPATGTGYMALPELEIDNEADLNKELGRQAKEYILREPGAFVARMARRMVTLHDRETIGVVWNEKGLEGRFGDWVLSPLKLISTVYWWCMLGLAIAGIALMGREKGVIVLALSPPIMTWAYFALVHSVTVGGDRYHVPSIPFVALLSAYALAKLRTPFLKGLSEPQASKGQR